MEEEREKEVAIEREGERERRREKREGEERRRRERRGKGRRGSLPSPYAARAWGEEANERRGCVPLLSFAPLRNRISVAKRSPKKEESRRRYCERGRKREREFLVEGRGSPRDRKRRMRVTGKFPSYT